MSKTRIAFIGAGNMAASLIGGLLVSIFQAATQINEQMLSFLRNPNYKLTPTLKFVEKYVAEERAKGSQWGYDVPYMLTGALNRHPRAAIAFLKDNRTDYNELYMDLLNELS